MNRSLGLLARIAMLTVAFLATHTAFLHLVPAPEPTRALSDALAREAAASLPQVAFLTATTIAAVVMRSRWQGGRLFGALFALLFGLGTLVPLLEPLAFPAYGAGSDAEHLRHNLLLGASLSLVLSAVALVLFGRLRSPRLPSPGSLSTRHWPARLAGGAVAFVVFTLLAAWVAMGRQSVFGFFHGLAGSHSFAAWLGAALALYPWLPGAQALRALVAAAALLPALAGDRGPRHAAAALAGAATAVLVGAPLLVPSGRFDETVRLTHLAEVIWTMLPLGVILAELILFGQGAPTAAEPEVRDKPILGLSDPDA